MKTSLLSKDSWHWHLAHTYGNAKMWDVWDGEKYVDIYEGNFCKYFWQVVGGALWAMVITAILAILGWCIVDFFLWSAVWLMYHRIDTPMGAALFIGMLGILVFLCVVGGVAHRATALRTKMRQKSNYKIHEPGFFTLAYRKFKDKTCFKIEVR